MSRRYTQGLSTGPKIRDMLARHDSEAELVDVDAKVTTD